MKKQLYFLVAVVVVAVAIFASCKSDDPTKSDKNLVTLRLRWEGPVSSLNPIITRSGYSRFAAMRVFQTLGAVDPKTLKLEPILAKSIPQMQRVTDGKHQGERSYTFEINDAARWDNGTPVTAKDIEFSLKIVFNPEQPDAAPWRGYYEFLSGFDTDPANARKFTVYLSRYYILELESITQLPIYPAYNYDPNNRIANIPLNTLLDTTATNALMRTDSSLRVFAREMKQSKFDKDPAAISGSGPYKLLQMAEQETTLGKKADWWGNNSASSNPLMQAYPDRLVYHFMSDEDAIVLQLKNHEIDVVANMSVLKFRELQQNPDITAAYRFDTIWSPNYNRWVFNLANPKLKDPLVRRALSYVVDYDYIINTVLQGMGTRVVGPVSPRQPHYAKDIPLYNHDIEKAKQLLAQAGWKDSDGDQIVDKMINGQRVKLSLEMLTSLDFIVSKMISERIQEEARKAGVEIVFKSKPLKEISPLTRKGDFETAVYAAAQNPVMAELKQMYSAKSLPKEGGDNRSNYINLELTNLIEEMRCTEDPAQRNAMYIKAQQILHDDAPEVFLYSTKARVISAKTFEPVLMSESPGMMEQLYKPGGKSEK